MDPKKIAEYSFITINCLALLPMTHFIGLYTTQILFQTSFLHKKIESQKELEQVVAQEAIKLKLDPSQIDVDYKCDIGPTEEFEKGYQAYATRIRDRYKLCILSHQFSNRATVKHELYHILKDLEKHNSDLKRFLICEPRATLYGCFGIKL